MPKKIFHSQKWHRVKEIIRKILGRNLKGGKFVIAKGMK